MLHFFVSVCYPFCESFLHLKNIWAVLFLSPWSDHISLYLNGSEESREEQVVRVIWNYCGQGSFGIWWCLLLISMETEGLCSGYAKHIYGPCLLLLASPPIPGPIWILNCRSKDRDHMAGWGEHCEWLVLWKCFPGNLSWFLGPIRKKKGSCRGIYL